MMSAWSGCTVASIPTPAPPAAPLTQPPLIEVLAELDCLSRLQRRLLRVACSRIKPEAVRDELELEAKVLTKVAGSCRPDRGRHKRSLFRLHRITSEQPRTR